MELLKNNVSNNKELSIEKCQLWNLSKFFNQGFSTLVPFQICTISINYIIIIIKSYKTLISIVLGDLFSYCKKSYENIWVYIELLENFKDIENIQ